jgi:enoyl-CoA hydratase/carnithine racemase
MSPHENPQGPLVLRDDAHGIATLTLNHPHTRNALSQGMIDALQHELDALAADMAVHVVVLRGEGSAFCAGHDLKEIRGAAYGRDYAGKLFDTCGRLMQSIISLPQPVIAQVDGIATAAGVQLVASCDLAIASEQSRFATPGVNIGLFCSTPMVALSRNVSRKHAMQMLLTGDLIDAETAARIGLINEVVAAEELDDAIAALAGKIAAKSRRTISIGKEAFYRQAELPLAEAYAYTRSVIVDNLQTRDAQEGISAFIEKRSPEWHNR